MDKRKRELKPGTILANQYKIESEIGAGGFAITYKGVNIKNDVAVAVKEFCPLDEGVEFEHERERFIREAGILREFDYLEGIVSVRDVFEEDNKAYLVMDYIEGITLKDYVAEYGNFSWDDLIRMVTPVMRSLTKIHRRNVIHCDISPDNLMIGMDNRLWLIDFGATQHTNARSDRTVIVKQGYAPIEQYYSDGSGYDGRIGPWTDVYAFAATMYFGLIGDKPRPSVERMKSAKEKDERSASLRDKEWETARGLLEEWQVAALMKGMAVNKAERFAAMDDFLEALSFEPQDNDRYTRVVNQEPPEKKKIAVDERLFVLLFMLIFLVFVLVMYILFNGYADRKKEYSPDIEQVSEQGSMDVSDDKEQNSSGDEKETYKNENFREDKTTLSEIGKGQQTEENPQEAGTTSTETERTTTERTTTENYNQQGTTTVPEDRWTEPEQQTRQSSTQNKPSSSTGGNVDSDDWLNSDDDDDLY